MLNKCCICLNDVGDNGIVTFKCNHKIHLKCYIECLMNNTIFCPLCRVRIEENIKYYNLINKKFNFLYNHIQKDKDRYNNILIIIMMYFKLNKCRNIKVY